MRIFKSIFLIINYKSIIVTLLSIASTYLCRDMDIKADFPLTLVAIAIVFPVVFSIDSAYKRREFSLTLLSDFKAHTLALYLAARDWLEPSNKEFSQLLKNELVELYQSLKNLLTNDQTNSTKHLEDLNKRVSDLSLKLQKFRELGLQTGEVSRVSQYISKISVDIENLKTIFQYRTPVTLRAYSSVFIYSFPVLYGPYFVFTSEHYSNGLEYMMPIIFTFILVSLDNIQKHLENPFDQVGEDDIKFDVEEFKKMLI